MIGQLLLLSCTKETPPQARPHHQQWEVFQGTGRLSLVISHGRGTEIALAQQFTQTPQEHWGAGDCNAVVFCHGAPGAWGRQSQGCDSREGGELRGCACELEGQKMFLLQLWGVSAPGRRWCC